MAPNYDSVQQGGGQGASPYGSGEPFYNESAGFISPPKRKGVSNWIKIGVPVLILVIIGAVVGGVVGSRKSSNGGSSAASSGSNGGAGTPGGEAAASSAASAKLAIGQFAQATNSEFMVPIYPSTTNSAAFTTPTFNPSNNAAISWPKDTFQPSSPDATSVRTDRPRLIAPAYMWTALPNLISSDPYLKAWNETIFGNATAYAALPPVVYNLDGDSGILDNSREIKQRIKAFAYVYRLTNETKWADCAWAEIENAASDNFGPKNDTKWNPTHFLDTAEMSAAYGIAYDWLHDVFTDDQKTQLRGWLIQYGLAPGVTQSTTSAGWWRTKTTGNWNCVCNGGLTLASLAILGEDETGTATQLLGLTIDNAKQNCANAPSSDGTWAETPNYWYFGTTGHAEMASALLTATGSHYGLLDTNAGIALSGKYHMYVTGTSGSMFDYGDHGPNKFSTTANSMFLYAKTFNKPQYSLFQRDRVDAAEPWSMFWYDPTVSGAFWEGQPLDAFFDNTVDQWASMRSSWTDEEGLYVAMKAGKNQGFQTHNDLDVGDFVLDALGTRWAGELGSADYLSPNYFTSDEQNADRWKYYRKMTEGQNTILINKANQDVTAAPTAKFDSSGTPQDGSTTVFSVPKGSTAFLTTDMTSAYFSATSVKRGIRLINNRKQVLIQDEINAQSSIQWRMHTNATISIDSSGTSATLTRDGKTMKVAIISPSSGATMSQSAAKRFDSDPTPPAADQENPGISVLIISMDAGTFNLQVLFNPQWSGMSDSDFVNPPSVDIDSWSLTSHN